MILRALLLVFLLPAALAAAPVRLLLIGQGPDGHPPTTHEYMAGVRVVQALLKPYESDLEITTAKADEPWPEGPGLIDKADGIVLQVTQGARWMQSDPERSAALKRFAERKGGLVALHWSIGAYDAQYIAGQVAMLGGSRGGPQRKYKVLDNDVHIGERAHPILRGVSDFHINDEFYYNLDMAPPSSAMHRLVTTPIDGKEEVIGWAFERADGGRSFGYVGLHFFANWKRVEYRRMVTQAILWTLGLPIPDQGVKAEVDPAVLELPGTPEVKTEGEKKP
jgi:type 1 glutamine amidotransferase